MKYATDLLAVATAVFACASITSCARQDARSSERTEAAGPSAGAADTMRMAALKRAALDNGLLPAEQLRVPEPPKKVDVGRLIFESRLMSFNGAISCRDCHLDRFGSADGLPNAIGVGGSGEGPARLHSGGRILPRNVLPLWGRGSKDFTTFFWDGKVRLVDGKVVSQFGDAAPANDPLTVAAHLPSVELREMVTDTPSIRNESVVEDVDAARQIQISLAGRFARDLAIGPRLAATYGVPRDNIKFRHVAESLAAFIRDEFRIKPTPFERFVFGKGPISKQALNGGIIFYGRGKCVSCHNGPYFSDLQFHAVAFPQAGFGKNGFGIDEGRYNVTLNPKDRFLFRTAPLHNLTRTAPYSHSGSVVSLQDAIIAHFDPLRLIDPKTMPATARTDFYRRLGPASRETLPTSLTDKEVEDLAEFLKMLEF